MKFLQLEIQNFCTIEALDLSLTGQGLVLITGENGSGKSLIFDALCWCLWGNTPRGISGDEVVNRWKKKDCYVAVTFEENNNTYKVERHRANTKHSKPDDLVLNVNGNPEGSAASMKLTQDRINAILGLEFDTFRLMMPGAGVKAAELTDAAIKEHLEKIMQTEVLTKSHELAKAKVKELTLQEKVKEAELSNLSNTIKSLQEEVGKMCLAHDQHAAVLANQEETDLARLTHNAQTIETLTGLLARKPDILEQRGIKESELNKLKTRQRELNLDFEVLKARHNEEYIALVKKKTTIQGEIKRITEDLNKFDDLAFCGECLQEVPEEHVATQREKLLSSKSSKEASLEATLAMEKNLKEVFERESASRKNMLLELSVDFEKIQSEIAGFSEMLQKFEAIEHKLQFTKDSSDLIQRNLENMRNNKVSPYADLIKDKENQLVELRDQCSAIQQDLLNISEQKQKYEFWVEGFSAKGIRSYMLKHITPILNERAEHYAKLLTGGTMKVRFHTERTLKNKSSKEEFNIEVLHNHGSGSYKGSSKGERARADLIIAFSIGDLAGYRANKLIPFRFLDEPFESVDEAGTEAIVHLLNEQKDKYETVFVITHNNYLKQLFSNKIIVSKKSGKSKVEFLNG